MRVAIHYRDGTHYMYDPSNYNMAEGVDKEEWLSKNTIEISEEDWICYQHFMEESREWNEFCLKLSNIIWDQTHPEQV